MEHKSIHLKPEELRDLTDRKLPSKQIAWLKENGWKFAVSAEGRPKVARTYYDSRLGIGVEQTKHEQEPDFSHWEKQNGGAQKEQPGTGDVQAVRLRRKAA